MERKSLKDISLDINENEYRNDGALHYSMLTTFERSGVHGVPNLFNKKESPSLTFGSVVDCLITGDDKEFKDKFVIADVNNNLSDTVVDIIKKLYLGNKDIAKTFDSISDSTIIELCDVLNYGKGWKIQTRLDKIKQGADYYNLLSLSESKQIISSDVYNKALDCVESLKTAPVTSYLFQKDNPFDNNVERLYQLKFRILVKKMDNEYKVSPWNLKNIPMQAKDHGYIPYTIMADEILVLHDKKKVIPIDLKTSSHYEDEFYKSFLDWSYDTQARLYSKAILAAMQNDDYFKDFALCNYHFVVVNKETNKPMVWRYDNTFTEGTLTYGKNNQYSFRHPFDIGEDLNYYLNNPDVTINKDLFSDKPNDLCKYLKDI